MKQALKEWAVVIDALAEGRQLFLLRKGGIAEGKNGFELKHSEFLFSPTWEHQQRQLIQPPYRRLFDQLQPPSEDEIEIRFGAKIHEIFRAPQTLSEFEELELPSVWTREYLRIRYNYRPDLPLYLVLVEPFRLPRPVSIPNDRRYRGCRSWVELYRDVPTAGSEPVNLRGGLEGLKRRLTGLETPGQV